jgi:FOG: Ankyrin repeat
VGISLLLLCVLVLLPLWPAALSTPWRWGLAVASTTLAPLLHGLVQGIRVGPAVAPSAAAPTPLAEELFAEAALPPAPLEPVVPGQLGIELYEAARAGRVDRALQLLAAGADAHALPPAEGRDQRQLTVLAAVLPDLRLLRALIAAGVDLNQPHRGMTALLAATRDSWHGRPEAVMTLLANGADVRIADAEGNTPLHFAARTADPGVAALLRDAAAELDVLNNEGYSPLAIACQAGNWRLARFLLERGAKADLEHAVPALVAAAAGEDDDPAGVQLLLKHKARVDARDRSRRSALHLAAAAGHLELIQVLMNAGANLEARDNAGRTPFLEACAHARSEAVQALLPYRPDLHAVDGSGLNGLWLASAAEGIQVGLIQQLLALQLDPGITDAHGRRAVDMAAAAGRWAVVAALDPGYELPAAVSEQLSASEPGSPPAGLPDRRRWSCCARRWALATPAAWMRWHGCAARPSWAACCTNRPCSSRSIRCAGCWSTLPTCRSPTAPAIFPVLCCWTWARAACRCCSCSASAGCRWPGVVAWHAGWWPARARSSRRRCWKPSRWNSWTVAWTVTAARRPVTRRCRWPCVWAGCSWPNACCSVAPTARLATAAT